MNNNTGITSATNANIDIDTIQLESEKNNLKQEFDNLKQVFEKMIFELNELRNVWHGNAADAFISKMTSVTSQFDNINTDNTNYIGELEKVIQLYRSEHQKYVDVFKDK